MNPITINPDPAMTRYVVERTELLRENPVVIVDVGARWGFNSEWRVFGDCLRMYCFEPDEAECARLNKAADPNVTYIPIALGAKSSTGTLYETKVGASSGLYRTNMTFFSRLLNGDNAVIVREHDVKLSTLDAAMQQRGVAAVDFVKIDVEGAELDVLLGGEQCLQSFTLLGVLSEFRFQEEINGAPVFWQLDRHLRGFGFRLFGMQFSHQSRRALPYASMGDYRLPNGERYFAYTRHGQIMDGDALYFRDLLIPANRKVHAAASVAQLVKAAAFFEIYSLNDCAAELIIESRDRLEQYFNCDALLDRLTPSLRGSRVSYDEYMQRYFEIPKRSSAIYLAVIANAKAVLRWIVPAPILGLIRRLLTRA
jgi:FkbM family methyltransferase